MEPLVPQPAVDRLVDAARHALVVGVHPRQDPLVALTAASWARAVGAPALYLGYADVSRFAVEEHPDGSVRHEALDPDAADDSWRDTETDLRAWFHEVLHDSGVPWELRYLAGRPDRALTHLARAVDAAAIVVGTRAAGSSARLREIVEGSVAVHLAHHQHRPVLTVPLSVVDWKVGGGTWH